MIALLATAALALEPSWPVLDDAAGWSPLVAADEGDVHVVVEHRRYDGVDCYRATTTVQVPPAALRAVVVDVPHLGDWGRTPIHESRVLAKDAAGFDYLVHLDVPAWTLASDRFWVMRGEVDELPDGTLRFRWHLLDAAARYPELHARLTGPARAVEITANFGAWVFTPTPAGTRASYRVCTDAGGAIPDWLQRMTSRRTLPEQVAAMVAEARRRAAGG